MINISAKKTLHNEELKSYGCESNRTTICPHGLIVALLLASRNALTNLPSSVRFQLR